MDQELAGGALQLPDVTVAERSEELAQRRRGIYTAEQRGHPAVTHDVEVVRAASGAPSLALRGKAASLAAELGVAGWRLSITHTDETAHAVAVAL